VSEGYGLPMRIRALTITTLAIGALGLGTVALGAAPASAKSVSSQNLKALASQINKGKHLTYSIEYKTVSDGKTQTVTIAQSPPKTYFASSGSVILNNGKTTYYCSPNESGNSGDSGNSGAGNSGNSGNSGSGKSYFQMVKYSAHPSSSLFNLPAGATTVTIPTIPNTP
jgi:hypothetical protein